MRRVLLVLTSALFASHASADYNADKSQSSPSGKFRFEARSPDNAAGKREDQKDFDYSLTDTASGKTLWTRTQPGDGSEDAPRDLFVSDDGDALVRTDDDGVFLLDRETGKKSLSFFMQERFTKRERAEFVLNDSPPVFWGGNSRWYFLSFGEGEKKRSLFVIRAYWGRRVAVDLKEGRLLEGDLVTPEIEAAARAEEERWAREILARYGKKAETTDYPVDSFAHEEARAIECAAFLAGVLELRSEIEWLRKLEKCRFSGYVSGMGAVGRSSNHVRQAVQTALRRLGEAPRRAPGIELNRESKKLTSKVKVPDRGAHAGELKKGMSLDEVLATIGLPDYEDGEALEYDVDGESPVTLKVHFTEDFGKVTWIERIDPPVWKKVSRRDMGLGW